MVMEVKVVRTVKIRHPDNPEDFMIINESDFNKKKHELFDKPLKRSKKTDKLDSKPETVNIDPFNVSVENSSLLSEKNDAADTSTSK